MAHKIAWTDFTWNPYWGCEYNCSFCYAKKFAKRFWATVYIREKTFCSTNQIPQSTKLMHNLSNFYPTMLWHRMDSIPKKPCKVFVNSMSDISCWKISDFKIIIEKMKLYPNHIFQILTKNPIKLKLLMDTMRIKFSDNIWLGLSLGSIENNTEKDILTFRMINAGKHFISLEPYILDITEKEMQCIQPNTYVNYKKVADVSWIIIGGCTGVKNQILQQQKVLEIISFSKHTKIPLFFKSWGDYIPAPQLKYLDSTIQNKILQKKKISIDNIDYYKAGAKLSGNIINNKRHQQFPIK